MTASERRHSELRVVRDAPDGHQLKVFCGHCGRPAHLASEVLGSTRVCQTCGMGLLVEAPIDVAPAVADPFLIVDPAMAVCALSRQAERLLGVAETDAVNRHIRDLLVPAETEPTKPSFSA